MSFSSNRPNAGIRVYQVHGGVALEAQHFLERKHVVGLALLAQLEVFDGVVCNRFDIGRELYFQTRVGLVESFRLAELIRRGWRVFMRRDLFRPMRPYTKLAITI